MCLGVGTTPYVECHTRGVVSLSASYDKGFDALLGPYDGASGLASGQLVEATKQGLRPPRFALASRYAAL